MNDNDKIKIDEALSHIKKSIIEKNKTESENLENDDFILLDQIISKKEPLLVNKESIKKNKYKKKIDATDRKVSNKLNNKKRIPNKKNEKKHKTIKLNKNKSPVDNLVDKEIKPIIKKWIDKNLRNFVKDIVVEEMKSISKATQKPSNR